MGSGEFLLDMLRFGCSIQEVENVFVDRNFPEERISSRNASIANVCRSSVSFEIDQYKKRYSS